MTKKISAPKWIALFAALSLLLLGIFGAVTYIVDPYFQYRIKDNSYKLNGWYVGAGLIKNYDYDTLIIGSSMTQNFNMDVFRENLSCLPLHVGLSGMNWRETQELLRIADRVGKATDYYICVDLSVFNNDNESRIARYLLEDSLLAKARYSLSYESWFVFMPVDIGLSVLKTIGFDLPQKYTDSMSIDQLENWSQDYSFGEDVVLDNYKAKAYSVSAVDVENLLNRMISNIDMFLKDFDTESVSYHFFFPPYSSLYWCDTQTQGYYDIYSEAKKYFIKKATALNCEVYDFQSEDITLDLNNYKDTTHYSPDINDWMVTCFASGKCLVTPEIYDLYQLRLLENTNRFRERYSDLFEPDEP